MKIRPLNGAPSHTRRERGDSLFGRNRILGTLPASDRATLWSVGKEVEYGRGREVVAAQAQFTHVYFPETCVFSIITDLRDGNSVESGTIGYEGFVGLPVLLGGGSWPQRTIVQIPGTACVVERKQFLEVLPSLPLLHAALNLYAMGYISQISQTAACNSQHNILQRCARWILLTHDRIGSREVPLTQEFMSFMLGVRRPSVTVAQSELKRRGLIRYSRGKMEILDRAGLEGLACECHAVVRREFGELTGAYVG